MSEYVDERVVEMRFDNQNFEKNVQTSLKTLSELHNKLKLDDAGKSFDSIQKASSKFDLSNLVGNVQTVADRFSFLGIVGDEVIRRLTNGFLDLGQAVASTVKSLTIDQVGVGFDKYERKVQSVQTIMNATGKTIEDVSASLDKLNWFTDETSYSYSDMVDNISKFTNANVPLEVAVTSMIGIADAAGLAGASVGDASHAMEGFSKAIAQGYMSRQNWQWIRTAHMDTTKFKDVLIQAALAEGTLQKSMDGTFQTIEGTTVSIADFETALKDGWMTTEVMNKALAEFGGTTENIYQEYLRTGDLTSDIISRMAIGVDDLGLKSFRAAQEAKTFSDAINAVKDAVSTGWMTSFEKVFGNYEEARGFWTDVANEMWDIFASGGEARNDLIDEVFTGSFEKLKTQIISSGLTLDQFEESLRKVATSKYGNIDNLVHKYGSLSEALKAGEISGNLAKDALRALAGEMNSTSGEAIDLNAKLEEVKKKVSDVISGVYGNGDARKKALEELGDSYEYIQGLVNTVLTEGRELTLDDVKIFEQEISNITNLTDAQREALMAFIEGTDDAAASFDDLMASMNKKSGQELVHEMVLNILGAIKELQQIGSGAFDNIFGGAEERAKVLRSIIEGLYEFTEQLTLSDDAAKNLGKTLEGFLSIAKFIGITFERIFYILSPIKDLFDISSDSILEFTGNIGETVTEYVKWYESSEEVIAATDRLRGYVSRATKVIKNITGFIRKLGEKHIPIIKKSIEEIVSSVKKSKLSKYIGDGREALKDAWNYIEKIDFDSINIDLSKVSGFIDGVCNAILSLYNTIKSYLSPYISNISGAFTNLGDALTPIKNKISGIKTSIDDAGGIFGYLSDKIKELWGTAKSFVEEGGLLSLFEGFADSLDPIRDKFDEFIKHIGEEIKGIEWSQVLAFSLGFSLIPAILSISAAFAEAAKLFKTGKGVLGTINTILTKFKNGFKTTAMEIAEAAVAFSVAIAILAGSLWLLSEKTDPEKLKNAAIAMMEVMGVFAAMVVGIGVISKFSKDLPKTLVSLLALAGAVAILAGALYAIQKVKFDSSLIGRIVVLLGMMAALFAVALGFSKLGVKMEGVGLYFLTFAGAIYVLAMAMEKISGIQMKKLDQAMEAILLLMAGLGAITAISKLIKGSSFGLLALIGATILLVKLLEKLGDTEISKLVSTAKKNLGLFGTMFVAFGLTAVLGRIAGKEASGLGISVALMAASLLIVYEAIKLFGGLDKDTLVKGGTMVAAVMALFAILAMASSRNYGKAEKLGVAIAVMSSSLLLVYWAVKKFSSLDTAALNKGLGSIVIIFGMYAALLATTALAGKAKVGPIVAMGAVLVALVASIAILSLYKWDDMKAGVISLGVLIAELGLLMFALGKVKIDKAQLFAIGEAIVMLATITWSLSSLAGKDWASLLSAAASISAVLLAVAAAIKIMDGVSINGSAIGGFAIGLIGVWAIGQIIGSIAELPWSGMLSAAASISMVLLSVSAAIRIMNGIKIANAAEGAAGLLVAIVILGAGLLAIGWLFTKFEELEPLLQKGVTIAGYIGDAIGALVGGIFAGIAKATFDILPEVGQDLADFMENAKPFFDGLANVPSNIGLTMASIAGGLAALMAENALSNIFSLFTGSRTGISGFSDQMLELAAGLKAFADNAPDPSQAAAVGRSTPFIKTIIEVLNSLPRTGGLWQLITGNKDMKKLGEQLASFGKAITAYGDSVANLNTGAISASMPAVDDVLSIAASVPTSGGLIGLFTGKTDWKSISNNLRDFGLAMRNYSGMVDGLNVESIASSVPAAGYIEQIANNIPKSGGISQFFGGSIDMKVFGQQLVAYAEAIKTFSETAGGINYGNIEKFSNLKLTGENMVNSIANGINSNSAYVSEAIVGVLHAAQVAGIANAKDLLSVGLEVSANVATGITNSLPAVTTAISNYQPQVKAELTIIAGLFSSVFTDNMSAASSAVSTVMTACLTQINSRYSDFGNAGMYLMRSLSNGMGSVVLSNSAVNAISSCVSAINGYYWSFYNAGSYLVSGVADGIYGRTYAAVNAVISMTQRMNNAFYTYNMIRSPSRLYAKAAGYIPEGVAKGIDANSSMAEDSIEAMGYDMITAISPALAILANLVNGEFEISPSIKPVVDLSDVYENAEIVNGLFADSTAMARARAGYISRNISEVESQRYGNQNTTAGSGASVNPVINNYVYTQPGQDTASIADEVERRMVRSLTQKKVAFVSR